jgi:hypothetical protein
MKHKRYILSLATMSASRLCQGVVMIGTAVVVTTKAATTLVDGVMQLTTAAAEKAVETLGNSAQNAETVIKAQNASWAAERAEKKAAKAQAVPAVVVTEPTPA